MGKKKGNRGSRSKALNAFDLATEAEEKVKGRLGRNERISLSEDENDSNDELTNGEVKNKDDEDIDSDEAFGSDEDELEFMGRFKSRKQQEEEEDDDDEAGDSVDEDELLPLSEIWDMNEKIDQEESDDDGHDLKLKNVDEESSEEESSSSDDADNKDDEDDLDLSDVEEDEIDEAQLSSLKAQIADMSNTDVVKPIMSRKERLQVNRIPEGEFALPTNDEDLSLEDLVSDNTLNKKASAPLSVPLPKRIQQRHDRSAAYELTKDEVEKWTDTVKKNREAEYLQFPINAPAPVQKNSIYTPMPASTELEKKVQGVMKESGADVATETPSTFEELAPSKLSVEEVKKRRNELRMMRELMFRQEQKAKRIKKIKSKSYRKVHKKERERQNQLLEDEDGGSDAEDHDMKRAQERMSLKHKSTGKWAKNMINQGFTKDKETRAELEEMLRRGEDLKKKIEGDDEVSDDEAFINNANEEEDEENSEDEKNRQSLGKGLLGMKFMRDADERKRQQNRQELEALNNAKSETGFEDLDDDTNDGVKQAINAGRKKFEPGSKDTQEEMEEMLEQAQDEQEVEKEKSIVSKLTKKFDEQKSDKKSSKKSTAENGDEEEANPWLQVDQSVGALDANKTVSAIDQNSTSLQKSQDKIRKQRSKNQSSKAQNGTIIDMNETLEIIDPLGSDEEDGQAEDSASQTMTRGRGKLMSFKQKDLVKRAFSGDDVVADFQDEKRRKVEDEGDKEVDVTIPGWGSWGGNGAKSRRKFVQKVKGVKENKRKDAKLQNVIINEKVDKKNAKYAASNVPFPFENREQYERSLRMPVGPEWASRDTHQRLTKPRVTVKQGTVIDPIKAPFKS